MKQESTAACASVKRLNAKTSEHIERRERRLTAAVRFVFVASELG